jgi:hypothetical protein
VVTGTKETDITFVRNVFRIHRWSTAALGLESFVVSIASTPLAHWPLRQREATWKYSRALFAILVAEERVQTIVGRYACARTRRVTCCLATSIRQVKSPNAVPTLSGYPRSLRRCRFQRVTRTKTPYARHVPLEDVSYVRSTSSGSQEVSRQISVKNAPFAFFATLTFDEI